MIGVKIGKDTEKKARLKQEGRRADQYKIENKWQERISENHDTENGRSIITD